MFDVISSQRSTIPPPDVPTLVAQRRRSPLTPISVGVGAFLLLSAACLWNYFPPLPERLKFAVQRAPVAAGTVEPLITTGVAAAADFLYVKCVDADTVIFGYQRWGNRDYFSAPVKLAPGSRHTLEVEMPALAQVRNAAAHAGDRVRLQVDGAEVLIAPVPYHLRAPSKVFVGENPAGGSACGPHFSGEIFDAEGRRWRGGPRDLFSWRERVLGWVVYGRWQVFSVTLLSVALAMLVGRARDFSCAGVRQARAAAVNALRSHAGFVVTALVCCVAFAYVVTDGTFTFGFEESFGNFYDYQAAALLQGRLDVPEEALSGEAFVVDGKIFGYFGIVPALLRLPCAVFDIGFGKLSRSFMLADYAVCLVASYLMLREIYARLRPGRTAGPSPWTVAVFVGNVGLGTTLFFLGSRAYIYHEAILCGAAFALAGSYAALRYFRTGGGGWALGAVGCGLLAVHARPPVGLFALSLVAVVALGWAMRERRAAWRHLGVAALAAAAVLSFNALSYLKFRTFDGAPLRYNVQYNPERLARIDGRNFHLSNLPFTIDAYMVRPNFTLTARFPYFYIGGTGSRYSSAKIDLAEPTVAMPYAMPGVCVLATLGAIFAWCRCRPLRGLLVVLGVAVGPMALAMFAAIAISQRYTADFCPFLIGVAGVALVALEAEAPRGRAAIRAGLVALTLCSVAVTLALTLHFQGESIWGVPAETKQRYQHLRAAVDGFFLGQPRTTDGRSSDR